MSMEKVIFHIDLNAFFVNAEILLNPELEDKVMVVSGFGRRSVVSTASYSARKYGIHSGMALGQAKKLYPNLVIAKGSYSFYRKLSKMFITYIESLTDKVQQASIDECYADMTEIVKNGTKPLDLALEIQRDLLRKYHLKCSIGIGESKFVAKMASDMKKPLGITLIRNEEIPEKLWPLPISEMHGVGKKTAPHLKEIGIETIGDLANEKNFEFLRSIFGKNTLHFIDLAKGEGSAEIREETDAKSIGQSVTFNDDLKDYDEIKYQFSLLANKIEDRMKRENVSSKHISITIRNYEFNTIVRSMKLDYFISTSKDILEAALLLFDQNLDEDPVRLVGISCSYLRQNDHIMQQISLFDQLGGVS